MTRHARSDETTKEVGRPRSLSEPSLRVVTDSRRRYSEVPSFDAASAIVATDLAFNEAMDRICATREAKRGTEMQALRDELAATKAALFVAEQERDRLRALRGER